MIKLLTSICFIVGTVTLCIAQDLSKLYEDILPSVVMIYTSEEIEVPGQGKVSSDGIGSGVIIDSEGRILTASHVVHLAERIVVKFQDGETRPASVLYSVPSADVALIKIAFEKKGLTPAPLGNSDKVKVGNQIVMVGSPYGIGASLSAGHISGRHVQNTFTSGVKFIEYFQTDAPINKGNSGGPMVNLNGEVIGIASHIISESGGSQGLGFAATSNICKTLLLEGKSPWIGTDGKYLNADLCAVLNIPQKGALLIERVANLSPADIMGLRGGKYPLVYEDQEFILGGDIILAVNGIEVEDETKGGDLIEQLQNHDKIFLKVLREGEIITIEGAIK